MMPLVDKPKGRFELGDYVEVKERIRLFYEQYPDGRLTTAQVHVSVDYDDTPRVWVHAQAFRTADDPHPADGWSWMVLPGTSSFTRGSELENTETSAWGRAIGALGIGIAGSIATANEVRGKQDDHRPPPDRPQLTREVHDGLIGTFAVSGTQDGQLRETPDGWVLPFRLKSGSKAGQICLAHDYIAKSLANRGDLTGQRVTVWGTFEDLTIDKAGQTIGYKVLHLTRIKGDGFDLTPEPTEPPTDGLSAEEQAAMDELPW